MRSGNYEIHTREHFHIVWAPQLNREQKKLKRWRAGPPKAWLIWHWLLGNGLVDASGITKTMHVYSSSCLVRCCYSHQMLAFPWCQFKNFPTEEVKLFAQIALETMLFTYSLHESVCYRFLHCDYRKLHCIFLGCQWKILGEVGKYKIQKDSPTHNWIAKGKFIRKIYFPLQGMPVWYIYLQNKWFNITKTVTYSSLKEQMNRKKGKQLISNYRS